MADKISMGSISVAIQSIQAKKENLRKAFEELQKYSSFLASFALQWKDLETHFETIESSIEKGFKDLLDKEKQLAEEYSLKEKQLAEEYSLKEKQLAEENSLSPEKLSSPMMQPSANAENSEKSEYKPCQELKSICVNMDAKGLRSFVLNEDRKNQLDFRKEINSALGFAPDPAKLVLDTLQSFFPLRKNAKSGLHSNRKCLVFLSQRIFDLSPKVNASVKEDAKKLAVQWKTKIDESDTDPIEILGLLHFLASYDLASEFDVNDILDFVVSVAQRKLTINLFGRLGLVEKFSDFINKLTNKGQQHRAVDYIYAYGIQDKYPAVSLLKSYLKSVKKKNQEARKKGNNSSQSESESIAREISSIQAVLKSIDEHHLESQYPKQSLETRLAQLEKQKTERKRPAASSQPQKKQSEKDLPSNKRPRQLASKIQSPPSHYTSLPANASLPPTYPLPQPGLFNECIPYFASSNRYAASSGSVYDRPPSNYLSMQFPYGGNRSPPRSHLYSSEHHLSPSLYEKPAGYGAYPSSGSLPPPIAYPPAYYP